MAGVARLGDSISGMTSGEHNGHYDALGNPIHDPCALTGSITSNCSPNVFINGISAAIIGAKTTENDCCDSGQSGTVSIGSSSVFVNGKPLARQGDSISPHNGTASIINGSPNVFAGN